MNWFLMWFLFAFGQSQATPKPLAPPSPLETGSFQNGIYRNDQLGLIYRLPIRVRQIHSLAPDEKLVRKGKLPPQGYLSLSTYQSNSESLPSSSGLNTGAGDERTVIRIMAYYNQYYANSEDAIAYLRKLEKNAKGAADKVLRDSEECTFNGHKFYRSDFLRLFNPAIYPREPRGTYVWFATVWRGYLLVINCWTDAITGTDKDGMAWLMPYMNTIRLFERNSPQAPPTASGRESSHLRN
jgi:hypothetical protein